MASNKVLVSFLRAFLIPTIIGKVCIYYFGLKFSEFPGEGYGYGLAAAIAFTLGNLALFIWKFRDNPDP